MSRWNKLKPRHFISWQAYLLQKKDCPILASHSRDGYFCYASTTQTGYLTYHTIEPVHKGSNLRMTWIIHFWISDKKRYTHEFQLLGKISSLIRNQINVTRQFWCPQSPMFTL